MSAPILFLDGDPIEPAILATFGPVFDAATPGVRPHNIVNGDTYYPRLQGSLWQRFGSPLGPVTTGRVVAQGRLTPDKREWQGLVWFAVGMRD